MKQVFELYSKQVTLTFDEDAPRYRYIVDGTPVRGVTTVLGEVVDKPGLRAYAATQAMKYLFGAKWDEPLLKYLYDGSNAYLKANHPHTQDELQKGLEQALEASVAKAQRGKDIGSEVHALCEAFLISKMLGIPETLDDATVEAVKAFKSWFELMQPKVLAVEQVVYSRDHQYAGRFDCLLEIGGQTILCDLKTTNASRTAPQGIYAEHFLQLGGYSLAYEEEMQGSLFDDLMVINCSKQGKVSTLRASQLGLDVEQCQDLFIKAVDLHNFLETYQKEVRSEGKN